MNFKGCFFTYICMCELRLFRG